MTLTCSHLKFKYYNMWLSLITAFLCIAAMFLISWPVALITIFVVFALYLAVLYRSPGKKSISFLKSVTDPFKRTLQTSNSALEIRSLNERHFKNQVSNNR